MELKQYLELFKRWLWLIVLGAVLGAGSAFVVSSLQVPTYQATATLLISEAPRGTTSSEFTLSLPGERLSGTFLQLLTSRPVMEEVILRLGLRTSPGALSSRVRVELVSNTQLIRIHVTGPDPSEAATIANVVPEVFQEYNAQQQASRFAASKESLQAEIANLDTLIADAQSKIDAIGVPASLFEQSQLDRLQSELALLRQSRTGLLQSFESLRLAESQSINNILVIEPALTPTRPISPRTQQNTLLAGVVGLMIAAGIAFLIEYLDDTLKSPAQIQAALSLPVVGVLAKLPSNTLAGLPLVQREPRSPTAEAFRGLRTNLQFAGVDEPLRRLLVTSVSQGEGKSTVVANLATVMAHAGQRVIIIDADLRRPVQHRLLGSQNSSGLSEALLKGSLHLNGALQTAEVANLALLSTGAIPPNPAELLGSKKMASLLEHIGAHADRVIIDSPPVTAVTDAVILASQVDGVLLVIEAGKTKLGSALQVKEQLDRVGANIIGVVLNKVPLRRDGYYYNYYYHYYNTYNTEADVKPRRRNPLQRLLRRRSARHTPRPVESLPPDLPVPEKETA